VKDLDVTNPWEAHAYFALVFRCEDCHIYFSIASAHPECSDEWCIGLARGAFDAGWFIPLPARDSMDVMTS
jgi:hypothetical protein